MRERTRGALLALAGLLCLSAGAPAAQLGVGARTPSPQRVGSLARSQLLAQLNKETTVEGFYYDGSIPMIVESMETVQAEAPIPPDKYVALVGPVPPSFESGAKVKVTGQVTKPSGEELKEEQVVIRVGAAGQATVLQAPAAKLSLQPAAAAVSAARVPMVTTKRYALLIGGGKNQPNNHVRYWNDLWQMYHLLTAEGYQPANIRVVYAYGVPRGPGMPVNYPASTSGIAAAFSYFAPRVKADDTFYLLVCGQGSPAAGSTPTVYWAWPGAPVTPGALAAQVNRIASYKKMVIHMTQSYSGGFIPYLKNPKRVIITAAAAYRSAFSHPSYLYGNFDYWYLSALRGHLLLGGASVDADTNDNGKVSIAEAYNFTLFRPGGGDIPPISAQMAMCEDNGALPSRFGPLPGAGEGLLAAATYL